jgi:hypothetical protein
MGFKQKDTRYDVKQLRERVDEQLLKKHWKIWSKDAHIDIDILYQKYECKNYDKGCCNNGEVLNDIANYNSEQIKECHYYCLTRQALFNTFKEYNLPLDNYKTIYDLTELEECINNYILLHKQEQEQILNKEKNRRLSIIHSMGISESYADKYTADELLQIENKINEDINQLEKYKSFIDIEPYKKQLREIVDAKERKKNLKSIREFCRRKKISQENKEYRKLQQSCDNTDTLNTKYINTVKKLNKVFAGYKQDGLIKFDIVFCFSDDVAHRAADRNTHIINFSNNSIMIGLSSEVLESLSNSIPVEKWRRDIKKEHKLYEGHPLMLFKKCPLINNELKFHTRLSVTKIVETISTKLRLQQHKTKCAPFKCNGNKNNIYHYIYSLKTPIVIYYNDDTKKYEIDNEVRRNLYSEFKNNFIFDAVNNFLNSSDNYILSSLHIKDKHAAITIDIYYLFTIESYDSSVRKISKNSFIWQNHLTKKKYYFKQCMAPFMLTSVHEINSDGSMGKKYIHYIQALEKINLLVVERKLQEYSKNQGF